MADKDLVKKIQKHVWAKKEAEEKKNIKGKPHSSSLGRMNTSMRKTLREMKDKYNVEGDPGRWVSGGDETWYKGGGRALRGLGKGFMKGGKVK